MKNATVAPSVVLRGVTRGKPLRLRMTEAEFEEFTDDEFNRKAEWVDGEVIVPMATSIKHADILLFLLTLMHMFCLKQKLGRVLGPDSQIRFQALQRRRTPDILFLSNERLHQIRETYVEGAPDLAVEIVSPDSVVRDWREKYFEYQDAGVREYWVIDPMSKHVEVYALNDEGQYERIKMRKGRINSHVLSGLYLKPAWLWQDELPNPMDILAEFSAS
jgi:Uma2 family endonuclease